jgi:hypothetical protein
VGKAKTMDAYKSGEEDDAEASHVPVPGSDIVDNRVATMMIAMKDDAHLRSKATERNLAMRFYYSVFVGKLQSRN